LKNKNPEAYRIAAAKEEVKGQYEDRIRELEERVKRAEGKRN
jgi:hypothetical protein